MRIWQLTFRYRSKRRSMMERRHVGQWPEGRGVIVGL